MLLVIGIARSTFKTLKICNRGKPYISGVGRDLL